MREMQISRRAVNRQQGKADDEIQSFLTLRPFALAPTTQLVKMKQIYLNNWAESILIPLKLTF